MSSLFRIIYASLLFIATLNIHAEQADRDKPTQVEADQATYDDLKQTNTFTGNVHLTRGTLTILADQLTVHQDAEGYQYGRARGKPVSLREKQDGPGDQYIEAYAEQLEYDGRNQDIKLIGNAILKRIDGAQVIEDARGNIIIYDTVNESYRIEGGKSAAHPNNPEGRVRLVIQPKESSSTINEEHTGTKLKPAGQIQHPRSE